MARAFIVLARNDLSDSLLQVHDLKPNTSLAPARDRMPQSGYLTHFVQNDTVALTGAGPVTTNADYYGLAAYLVDNVENVGGGNKALTAAQANALALAILGRVASGLSLTLAAINVLINATAGVSDSDLDGTVANSESTGTVEEVLRILSGEVYKVVSGSAIAAAANGFPGTGATHTRTGYFTTAPNITTTGTWNSIYALPTPTQTGTQDLNHRAFRTLVETSDLHLSALGGSLATLKATDFFFDNPAYTYGSGGTAKDIGGTVIPSTYLGRAVTIYDATGAII